MNSGKKSTQQRRKGRGIKGHLNSREKREKKHAGKNKGVHVLAKAEGNQHALKSPSAHVGE